MEKVYVDVLAKYEKSGKIVPMSVIWDDGRKFQVDRVIDVRRRASLKVGGIGMRYTCSILGHERYLYLEENRWFVEAK